MHSVRRLFLQAVLLVFFSSFSVARMLYLWNRTWQESTLKVPPSNDLASGEEGNNDGDNCIEIHPPLSKESLEEIFVEYKNALWVVASVGWFGCCPTAACRKTHDLVKCKG